MTPNNKPMTCNGKELKLGQILLYSPRKFTVRVTSIKEKAVYVTFPDGKRIPIREKKIDSLLNWP